MSGVTRRDFLNGLAWLGASSLGWPLNAMAQAIAGSSGAMPYPPELSGLRGSPVGAFEAAHALAWVGARDFGPLAAPPEDYDLIVIGAGISGLAAANFYREQIKRDARILIVDNHDDFGGHATRNEFSVDGQTCLSYGGTQSLDTPSAYSKVAMDLLRSLGINLKRLAAGYDLEFFQRHQLALGVFYDAATYGRDVLLKSGLPSSKKSAYYSRHYLPGLMVAPEWIDTLTKAPLSPGRRAKLREVLAVSSKAISYFKSSQGKQRFFERSYVHFLKNVYQIEDPALLALLSMTLAEDSALGGAALSLPSAVAGGLLGLPPAAFFGDWIEVDEVDDAPGKSDDEEPYVYHFPDGNSTIARLLVKRLVPDVARFDTVEQCLTARFDYGALDRAIPPIPPGLPSQKVAIRLNSLAVHAENTASGTLVRYLRHGKLYEARARDTVMAGWHMMAAHIIPSLPRKQKEAMRANVKMPLVYAQVVFRQWQSLRASGVGAAYCPASYFQFVQMDFPVSLGDYQPRRNPDAPMVLLMIRMPCPLQGNGTPADLLRQGRADLLGTSFETFEVRIREQLLAMYGPHGFDAKRDIAAITVNRWPHGFVFDEAEFEGQPAHLQARRRHGRIVIANADAAGSAYTNAAIDMAWRAVQELKKINSVAAR